MGRAIDQVQAVDVGNRILCRPDGPVIWGEQAKDVKGFGIGTFT